MIDIISWKVQMVEVLENQEEILYSYYINPLNKDLQEKLFTNLIKLRMMRISIPRITTENEVYDFSRDYGLFFKSYYYIHIECLKRDPKTPDKLYTQKIKWMTSNNLKIGLKILWKGLLLYIGIKNSNE